MTDDREALYDDLGRIYMRAAVDALIAAYEKAPREPASSPGPQSLQQQNVEPESDGRDDCTHGDTAATLPT